MKLKDVELTEQKCLKWSWDPLEAMYVQSSCLPWYRFLVNAAEFQELVEAIQDSGWDGSWGVHVAVCDQKCSSCKVSMLKKLEHKLKCLQDMTKIGIYLSQRCEWVSMGSWCGLFWTLKLSFLFERWTSWRRTNTKSGEHVAQMRNVLKGRRKVCIKSVPHISTTLSCD